MYLYSAIWISEMTYHGEPLAISEKAHIYVNYDVCDDISMCNGVRWMSVRP